MGRNEEAPILFESCAIGASLIKSITDESLGLRNVVTTIEREVVARERVTLRLESATL